MLNEFIWFQFMKSYNDTLLKYFTAFEQIFFALFHQGEIWQKL